MHQRQKINKGSKKKKINNIQKEGFVLMVVVIFYLFIY